MTAKKECRLYDVIVVGCGGTGGFFIKEFARFMASNKYQVNFQIRLIMIDGDRVESSNLDRQSFMPEDVGRFKCSVFSEAIESCFSVKSYAIGQYLDTADQLHKIITSLREWPFYSKDTIPILVGCVDNHRARQVLHEYYYRYVDTGFYFDAANEFSNGEVVFSHKENGEMLSPPRGFFFPEVLSDDSPRRSEESCGAINEHAPQHIATNMQAAQILLAKICNLIMSNSFKPGIVYFDAMENQMIFNAWTKGRKKKKA